MFSLEKRKHLLTKASVSHSCSGSHPSPFVYFTPSIMQGLISQSRFELRHASAKERRAELLCGGKFPLHTSLEVDRSLLYAACFNLQAEQREQEDGGRTRSGEDCHHYCLHRGVVCSLMCLSGISPSYVPEHVLVFLHSKAVSLFFPQGSHLIVT